MRTLPRVRTLRIEPGWFAVAGGGCEQVAMPSLSRARQLARGSQGETQSGQAAPQAGLFFCDGECDRAL